LATPLLYLAGISAEFCGAIGTQFCFTYSLGVVSAMPRRLHARLCHAFLFITSASHLARVKSIAFSISGLSSSMLYIFDARTSPKSSLHVAFDCGSVLPWRRCDILCTSGFADEIMLPIIRQAKATRVRRILRTSQQRAAQIRYSVRIGAFAWPIMDKHDVIHKTGST